MQTSREMLEDQLERYEQELSELNSFITELHTMTAKHGTPTEQFAEDLEEAEHNIEYYEVEIAETKKQLGKPHGRLPQSKEQLVRAFIIPSVSFVAGVLLGSTLGGKRNRQ